MFLHIPEILSADEVARLRELSKTIRFVDGRASNPANTTKRNLQVDHGDPGYRESSAIVQAGLARNPMFNNFAFPKRIAPPLLCKYEPGMTYGAHADASHMRLADGILRSDLSCTVYLNEPQSYAGGELVIHLGAHSAPIKLPPGHAIVYPSTELHEVRPVTQGERLVSITFIESLIPDAAKREIVFTINEVTALEGATMAWENRMQLQLVSQNLQRMWSS